MISTLEFSIFQIWPSEMSHLVAVHPGQISLRSRKWNFVYWPRFSVQVFYPRIGLSIDPYYLKFECNRVEITWTDVRFWCAYAHSGTRYTLNDVIFLPQNFLVIVQHSLLEDGFQIHCKFFFCALSYTKEDSLLTMFLIFWPVILHVILSNYASRFKDYSS